MVGMPSFRRSLAPLAFVAFVLQSSVCFRFTKEPSDVIALNGSGATLECQVSGSSVETSWRYSVARSFDDVPPLDLRHDRHRRRTIDGSLELDSIGIGAPVGYYQCVASDPEVGTVVSRVSSVKVPNLPEFESEPLDLSVYERDTAFFPCAVRSSLPIRLPSGSRLRVPESKSLNLMIHWLKNEAQFHLDESRMTLMPSGALQIDSVERRDHGVYRCNVSIIGSPGFRLSRRGQLSINTDLSFAETVMAPRFIAEPRSQTVVEGSSLTMDCAALGNPPPDISWLNNGVMIDLNDLDSRFKLLGSGVLYIYPVKEIDAGTYQCRADNKEDSLDATAILDVQVPPRFVKKPIDKMAAVREDLELECEIYGKPEPTIQWLKNGEIIKLNNHDMMLVNGYNLRIRGLLSSDAGVFQCIGSNSAGNVQASAKLEVITTGIERSEIDKEEEAKMDNVTDKVPSEPLNLRAVIIKPRFVTLSWNEPQSTNGDIEAYTVIYKVNGSLRERMMNTTRKDIHEMNVSQLQPSTGYQFRVVAYNKNGPGDSTQILDITTQSEDQYLGPPLNLSVTHLNPTIIDVFWLPPNLVPGSKVSVDKYKLIWTKITGEENFILTSNLNFRLGDLTPFTEYGLRVVALPAGLESDSSDGAGSPSEQIFIKTLGDLPTAPPSNVTFEPLTSTSVAVFWETPPLDTINGDITGYKLKYKKLGRKKPNSISTAADSRTAVLKDLERLTTYQVRICVLNLNGSGPYTEWHNVETLPNDLDETQVPDMPGSLKGVAGVDSIYVTWTPPKSQTIKIRNYKLSWGIGYPDDDRTVLGESTRHFTIKNLDRNSEYVLSLLAKNDIGYGPPIYNTVKTLDKSPVISGADFEDGDVNLHGNRSPFNPSLLLMPPVGLKADVLSGTTAVVYWTDNTLPKSQVNDQRFYVVRYCAFGSQKYRYFNTTHLNCMIDDLRPNTLYEFTVKVIKADRESEWSMVVTNSTLESAPASSPRELAISPSTEGSNSLTLHWAPPSKANGVITGYVIMHTTDRARRDRDWVVQAVVGGGTSALVRQLKPSTTYYFKVQARNSKGYGPFSAIVPFTTKAGMAVDDSEELTNTRDTRQNHSMIMYGIVGLIGVIIFVGIITTTVICCRKASSGPPTSPDTRSKSTYQKSSASNIKPPDLWIHHDQMEFKQLDKSHHSSSGSGDGASAMSSMTLQRPPPPRDSCEYDTAMPGGGGSIHHQPSTGSLDKHHYVPTYVDSLSVSMHDEEPPNFSMRNSTLLSGYPNVFNGNQFPKPSKPLISVDHLGNDQSMSSINTCGSGPGISDTLGSSGMRSLYPRPQYSIGSVRGHMTIDQNTPLLSAPGSSMSGTLPSQSSINSLGQMGATLPLHHHSSSMGISPMSCSQMSCGIGPVGSILHGAPMSPSPSPASEGFPADAREREQGHYVAYEALHPPRDGLESSATGSLSRGHAGGTHPLRSFSVPAPPPNEAPHTPHHHNKVSVTIRPTNTSPYKKPLTSANVSTISVPTVNRLQHGHSVPHSAEEVEALAPSHSTERLHQEMANLEGLMKDLNAITASQFEC